MSAQVVTRCDACRGRGYRLFQSVSLWDKSKVVVVKEPCQECGGTGEVTK